MPKGYKGKNWKDNGETSGGINTDRMREPPWSADGADDVAAFLLRAAAALPVTDLFVLDMDRWRPKRDPARDLRT